MGWHTQSGPSPLINPPCEQCRSWSRHQYALNQAPLSCSPVMTSKGQQNKKMLQTLQFLMPYIILHYTLPQLQTPEISRTTLPQRHTTLEETCHSPRFL